MTRCEQLEGDRENFLDASGVKVKKINKTVRALVGDIRVHVPLDDTYMAEAFSYKKQGGEYRLLPYKLPASGVCSIINNDNMFYPELVQASDFPMPFPCPGPTVSQPFEVFNSKF